MEWTKSELKWIDENSELIEKGFSKEFLRVLYQEVWYGKKLRGNFMGKIVLFLISQSGEWSKLKPIMYTGNDYHTTMGVGFNFQDGTYQTTYLYYKQIKKEDLLGGISKVKEIFKENFKRFLENSLDAEVNTLFEKVGVKIY